MWQARKTEFTTLLVSFGLVTGSVAAPGRVDAAEVLVTCC
jgi:hypothetical protein